MSHYCGEGIRPIHLCRINLGKSPLGFGTVNPQTARDPDTISKTFESRKCTCNIPFDSGPAAYSRVISSRSSLGLLLSSCILVAVSIVKAPCTYHEDATRCHESSKLTVSTSQKSQTYVASVAEMIVSLPRCF